MNLFLETLQAKEERPIMPSRAPLEIPGEMRAFAERTHGFLACNGLP
jgi:hypothetical protein